MAGIATFASLAERRRSAGFLRKIIAWFRREPSTDRLYILRVDFPVNADSRTKIEAALDVYRTKYDIDFLVIEPGIKLSRFDDI